LTRAPVTLSTRGMIYCVIPRELEGELLERMTEYYRGNPEVEVIIDRREGGSNDRRHGEGAISDNRRVTRDRRRPRAAGTFPSVDGPT
jgi:hypothetical protein